MRTWLVVAVLLSVLASPMLTKTPILEDLDDNLQHSSPIQAIISPSSGLTTGGEEITITGSGFLDMAWKNLTSDGNAYTWTTTTANYVYQSGWDPSIGVDSNGYRLGFGGGYYDRLFAHALKREDRPKIYGLIYDFQIFNGEINEKHDIKFDSVFTEDNVINFY